MDLKEIGNNAWGKLISRPGESKGLFAKKVLPLIEPFVKNLPEFAGEELLSRKADLETLSILKSLFLDMINNSSFMDMFCKAINLSFIFRGIVKGSMKILSGILKKCAANIPASISSYGSEEAALKEVFEVDDEIIGIIRDGITVGQFYQEYPEAIIDFRYE
jgi:hypothetical protein